MTEKSFESEREKIFSSLFAMQWNEKRIWEHIRDGVLSATPAFEGDLYYAADTKIMFVGRDLNGWDAGLSDCSTLRNTVESIVHQEGALDTLVDARGFGNGKRKYYHKNSNFFRFIKHILEFVGESDTDIDNTWYSDSKRWNQRFVWTNLYCISPRNPTTMLDSHFDNAMTKQGINDYIDLMELYIKHYKPDVAIFITDIYGWFVRWSRLRSFKDIVNNYEETLSGDTIVATGEVGKTKIIVCKRPDKRGTSHKRVQDMAEVVAQYITQTKEQTLKHCTTEQ